MEGDLGADLPTGREVNWIEAAIAAAALLALAGAFFLGRYLGHC